MLNGSLVKHARMYTQVAPNVRALIFSVLSARNNVLLSRNCCVLSLVIIILLAREDVLGRSKKCDVLYCLRNSGNSDGEDSDAKGDEFWMMMTRKKFLRNQFLRRWGGVWKRMRTAFFSRRHAMCNFAHKLLTLCAKTRTYVQNFWLGTF